MVHAPHSPMPQPYLVPTSPNASRSTHSSGVSDATSTERGWPFTRTVYLLMFRSGWRGSQGVSTTPQAGPMLSFYGEFVGGAITWRNATTRGRRALLRVASPGDREGVRLRVDAFRIGPTTHADVDRVNGRDFIRR